MSDLLAWSPAEQRAIEDREGDRDNASEPVTQEMLDDAQNRHERALGWGCD